MAAQLAKALAVDAEGQCSSPVPASLDPAGHPGSKRDFALARWKVRLTLKSSSFLAYTYSPLSLSLSSLPPG